jgi:hypothetical protein
VRWWYGWSLWMLLPKKQNAFLASYSRCIFKNTVILKKEKILDFYSIKLPFASLLSIKAVIFSLWYSTLHPMIPNPYKGDTQGIRRGYRIHTVL